MRSNHIMSSFKKHDHSICSDRYKASIEKYCHQNNLKLTPLRQKVVEILIRDHKPLAAYEILDNLSKASEMLITAEELTTQYETDLATTKKEAQQEISQLQKMQKESFDSELATSQKGIDTLVSKILDNFAGKKETVLAGLGTEIDSLSAQMVTKLFAGRA